LGRGSSRFERTVAVLNALFVLGGYIDAWAREQPVDPLVPWEELALSAGWFAVAGFLVTVLARNLARGRPWRAALPAGYHTALAGAGIVGLGMIVDVDYRLVVGFGSGMEALFAPTHLLELAGAALMVGAPLLRALRDQPERASWPVVVSAALTLSALTFFTLYANPLIDLWPAKSVPYIWEIKSLGVAALLIQTTLLTGTMVLLVRTFELPRGSLTVLCGLNGLYVVLVREHFELYPVMLVTGLVADWLRARLRPGIPGSNRLQVFAAAVPPTYTLVYYASIVLLEGGTYWGVQLWVGQVIAAAFGGVIVSYLAEGRWPQMTVAPEPATQLAVGAPRHVDAQTVKNALEGLDDIEALGASPLTELACVSAAAGRPPTAGADLRRLLVEIVRELAASDVVRDAEAGRLLADYYVRRVGSHEVVAERLQLSRPTFYRRLQRGLALVAERLNDLAALADRRAS
jgi:hypothetical protein